MGVHLTSRPKRPTGLRRALLRLPIALYRLRLGRLLGGRLLLLHHIGRISGLPRRVVLEVVGRDEEADAYVVACGFGPGSDWYRNVLVHPRVRIQIGGRVAAATAIRLPAEEGARAMARYAARHPSTAVRICRFMGYETDGSEADFLAVGRTLDFVRLQVAAVRAPSG